MGLLLCLSKSGARRFFDSHRAPAHGQGMKFDRFDSDAFLRDYWQKQPLLIRNPWAAWRNPLEPDELAGLACEEGVESRLIVQQPGGPTLETGPLAEERFAELGAGPWTLLVQAVDHHVPDVAALIEPFRFVPDWRIDDVMVSFATDGGGVGPHFDQYDVFLIQGLGRRRWRVGPRCDGQTPLLSHPDLRLIDDFTATAEWVLEPGDILYVPPCLAHDGVALSDDCMTYSVGFRAPSRAELVEDWCDHQVELLTEEDRYADPDLVAPTNPGEISAAALDRMQAMVLDALADRTAFARWFGTHATQPKYAEIDWQPESPASEAQVGERLAGGMALLRNPASRFAFVREQDSTVQLFVDGAIHSCHGAAAAFAEELCAQRIEPVFAPAGDGATVSLVTVLVNQGSLAFDEAD